ncbi:MAG TPA: carboxypeptidase-like regulatory domain-containing protein [Kofleriaceae bacterium]|nr:carboxypeptidase-like regulatory domain-containing protein [Kofleriaceae bacterium]
MSLIFGLVALVVGHTPAHAGKKERIAILGLEVVSGGSAGIDAESTKIATELTLGLRTRPKSGLGPYDLARNSEKELIDEKLISGCNNEEPSCMAQIGRGLSTDYLLYGRIEKKSQGSQAGYQISLKLLKVSNLAVSGWTDFIPLADAANTTKLQDWARKGYKKLTNENTDGTLVVKANIDQGTILIDNEERGNISSGKGEVTGLADGKYRLAVQAKGYQRWEADEPITIRAGETVTREATLKEISGEVRECDPAVSTCEGTVSNVGRPGAGWRKTAYIAGGTTVVLGIGFGYTWSQLAATGKNSGFFDYGAKCDGGPNEPSQCASGTAWTAGTYITAVGTAVGVVITSVAVVKGFITNKERRVAAGPGGSRSKQSRITVAPLLGPTATGATVLFDW